MVKQALAGLKIVEFGHYISGPLCAKLLGDLGAEVVKVELPQGDEAREQGPFPDDVPHPERSGLFLTLNANKLGVTLDPRKPTGREILMRLLGQADIFIENYPPSFMAELGLDYETLKKEFPRLVVTAITPWGQTGPYRDYGGYAINVAAAGGLSYGTGFPSREPLAMPIGQESYMAGFVAMLATMIALVSRQATGRSQQVDVSEAQVIAVLLAGYYLPNFIYKGVAGRRAGNRATLGLFPNCVLPCKDGHVCINCPQMEQYKRFLNMLGDPDWQNIPRYRDRRAMTEQYPDEAESLLKPWLAERTKEEIFDLALNKYRIPAVPVQTLEEVISSEHLASRDYFVEVEHAEAGNMKYAGPPYRFGETPWQLRRSAPLLGQHNEETYCGRLGFSKDELVLLFMAGII